MPGLAKAGVFFDLGGTLMVMRRDRVFHRVLAEERIDVSLEAVHAAYLNVEAGWLAVYGNKAITPEETEEAYRRKDAQAFLALFPDADQATADAVSKRSRERWPELEKAVPRELYPDAEPVLRRLSDDGYAMALVSNAPPETDRVVDELGLRRYIGTVVISGAVGFSKPHPEIFRIALRLSGADADRTVHVGDVYESDVVGARNAGIRGVLIDREGRQAERECARITGLDQVYELVSP